MANKLALFDCDGTLIDSQADICISMETAFEGLGLTPPDRSETRRIVGLSISEAVRRLAPDMSEAGLAQLGDGYRKAYFDRRAAGQLEEPLFAGMGDLLRHLDDSNEWLLGVATGKSDRGLNGCLTHHGIKEMFVTLQTADRHPSKPHPSMVEEAMADAGSTPERTIIIGDTTFDIEMAGAAGCPSIGVSWGYHEVDELRASGADLIVSNMDELKLGLESFFA